MKTQPSTLQTLCVETIKKCLFTFNIPDHWFCNGAFSILSNEQAQILLGQSMNLECLNLFNDCVATDVDLSLFRELTSTESAINNIIKSVLYEIFPMLQKLKLSQTAITDYGLAHLGCNRYQDIIDLDLSESIYFTFDGLSCLAELPKLANLNIQNCNVTLQYWPLSQCFEMLQIGGNNISSNTMVQISQTSSHTLENFSFWGLSTSEEGVEDTYDHTLYLLCFTRLKKLDLRWVSPLPLLYFSTNDSHENIVFTTLEELDLSYTNADDDTMKYIKDFKLLFLSLNGTKITRRSIRNISTMYSLQSLDLSNTNLGGEKFGEVLNFFNLVDLHTLILNGCEVEQRLYFTDQENTVITLFPLNLRVLKMNECTLILSGSDINFHLCESIRVLSNLKVLELSHAMFDKEHWEAVLTNKSRYMRLSYEYALHIGIL
jgi:Leucine-rich repeat (LRR) protein